MTKFTNGNLKVSEETLEVFKSMGNLPIVDYSLGFIKSPVVLSRPLDHPFYFLQFLSGSVRGYTESSSGPLRGHTVLYSTGEKALDRQGSPRGFTRGSLVVHSRKNFRIISLS